MACISCGVITSAWVWRSSSFCVSAMVREDRCPPTSGFETYYRQEFRLSLLSRRSARRNASAPQPRSRPELAGLEAEFLASVLPPHLGVGDDVLAAAPPPA